MTRAIGILLVVLIGCTSCAPKAQETVAEPQAVRSESRDSEAPPTQRDQDLIRSQIQGNWIVDIGMEGLEQMAAKIVVEMNPDGSIRSAEVDPSTDNGHPNWDGFAQSCLRAVLRSSPLRMPPSMPYDQWKQMTLVFNGRDLAAL